MKHFKKAIFIILGTTAVFATLSNFNVDRKDNNSVRQAKKVFADSLDKLLLIKNLGDFYYNDNGYNIDTLSGHTNNSGNKVKSISVYRYSTATQAIMLQDSILLNNEGNPILRMTPYDSRFSSTYYFYNNEGNRFLDITILENQYDTLYTLRRFDRFNRAHKSIQYNIKRKELDYLTTTDISPVSDSIVELKLIKFEPENNHKKILPFESRNMLIKQDKDSLVNVTTNRIVYSDTAYNSTYKNTFRIRNNCLIPENKHVHITFNSQGNWITKKTENFDIQRRFSYYATNENEIKNNLPVNDSILSFLYSQIDSLPMRAWTNYNEMKNSFEIRAQMVANGTSGDSITLQEANTLDAFLPKLWYQVSEVSGYITGIDSMCYVIGYNTPIKEDDNNNKRCLAIYEHRNGKYRLMKQSFGAIDYFNDVDNDLLFDVYGETNFSVDIQNGDIIVNYEYMRGEAMNEFAYEKGNWILVRYSSDHRTCCQFESSSYDYITKTYTSSISSFGDEKDYDSVDLPRDTTITHIQNRPIMYMDSVTIKRFDYDKDGDY